MNNFWKILKFENLESHDQPQDPSNFEDFDCKKCNMKIKLRTHTVCRLCSDFYHLECNDDK